FEGIAVEIGDDGDHDSVTGTGQLGYATMNDDTISGYQWDGIVVEGGTGASVSSASISDTTVTGPGTRLGSPGNAIEIDFGTITDCTIAGNTDYNASNGGGCGVLVFFSGGNSSTIPANVVMSNDTIDNNFYGVANFDVPFYGPVAAGGTATVINSTIS